MAIEFNVDSQVRPYATLSAFPITGSVKTLYIDESTSDLYYWDGSAYAIVKSQSKYEAIDAINGTGATVLKMSVCYLKTSSSSANTPELLLSNASSEATSSKTIGLLLQDLANGATGKIITSGEYDKFDTSAYNVGDRLWLSTTDGQVTTTIPSAPTHAVFIGFVTRKQSQNGRILVSIQNGYELREIHDVSIPTTPSNNEVLSYESVSSLWKPKSITTLLGFTPVPTTRTLTINGTTQDLSADRTFTISTGITIGTTAITSGTVGRVLFQGSGNVVQQSSSLFWDNTNEQLQLVTSNTSSAFRGLSVSQFGNFIGGAPIRFDKARGTSATPTDVSSLDIVGAFSFNPRVGGAYTQDRALFGANMASSTGVGVFIIGGTANNTYTPGVYVHPSNNVTIGSSQSIITGITDAGFKLDVNGTARVQTSAYFATTSGSVGIGTSSPAQKLVVSNPSGGATTTFTNTTDADLQILLTSGVSLISPTTNTLAFGTTTTERMRLTSSGTLLVGATSNNTSSDISTTAQLIATRGAIKYPLTLSTAGTPISGDQIRMSFNYGSGFSATAYMGSIVENASTAATSLIFGTFAISLAEKMRLTSVGNLLLNTTTDIASSKLTIESTTQGVLFPRMTTTQKNAIASPATGLMVYDTTLNLMALYNGTTWITL